MEKLRKFIAEAQHKNSNHLGRSFVCNQDIRDIFNRNAIHEALNDEHADESCKPEKYHIDGIIDAVFAGGHRTFAILVYIRYARYIRHFMESEHCHAAAIDHMLPFDKKSLLIILKDQIIVNEFYERQWHFTAPDFGDSVFTRSLPTETILPFVKEEFLEAGAFGELVRKESKARNGDKTVYETELRNLSILKLLRHPNIIEVLGSYAYQKRLNIIFPRARGGTLADMLQGRYQNPFNSDITFLTAIAGLCSAVSAVHHFLSSSHKLELIGCHHDLRPANIFIDDTSLLLADFGLARFKSAAELSETPPRTVPGYYSPPECYIIDALLERPRIHRSSDVWSLGCILAEAVTLIQHEVEGVTDFAVQRSFEHDSVVLQRFHRNGDVEPAVLVWLGTLQSSDSRLYRRLGVLLGEMLRIPQAERPSAVDVAHRARSIAIIAMCEPISELYSRICTEANSIEAVLERTRFDSWRYACGVLDDNSEEPIIHWAEESDYTLTQGTLMSMPGELQHVLVECMNPRSPIFQIPRRLNDLLIDRLSSTDQEYALWYLDTQMMLDSSVELAAAQVEDYDFNHGQLRRLKLLATVKSMTEVLSLRPSDEWRIERERLKHGKRVGDFKIDVDCLDGEGTQPQAKVLIESKTYKEYHSDQRTATELQIRLEDIVNLLRRTNDSEEDFRVLRLAGFYQDPAQFSCGLVYEYPSSKGTPSQQSFTTLRLALTESQSDLSLQPSLEHRFQLAQTLAKSVLQFHKVSWLQRSISSYNVVFFCRQDKNWLDGIADPYFLGFLYSRSQDLRAFTEGPTEDAHHRDYQHPEYRKGKLRFRAEYDYYSLGLILLEIGLWKPLDKILGALHRLELWKDPSLTLVDRVCVGCAPRLRLSMGSRYQQIVDTCLRGTFEGSHSSSEDARHAGVQQNFMRLVLEPLKECRV